MVSNYPANFGARRYFGSDDMFSEVEEQYSTFSFKSVLTVYI